MEKIKHTKVTLQSKKQLNVAHAGSGPTVLFLHGFPGTWYSWRNQLISLEDLDYRGLAPDLRGYGDSSSWSDWSSYTTVQIVGDLVELLDAFNVNKVFLVGHDWGAIIAWHFCLLRPDRVKAMVNTSVPFMLRDLSKPPVEAYTKKYGDDFYMCRFQDPKKVDDQLRLLDPQDAVRGFYNLLGSPTPPILVKNEGFDQLFKNHVDRPSWLRKKDVKHYADTFHKTGYMGGLNYYRAMDQTWELMGAYKGVKIQTPVKFVVGDQDFVYNLDGVRDYITNGLKNDVPNVEINVWSGVGHFLPEQAPEKFGDLVYDYFEKFN